MDSITQASLGAAVGHLCWNKEIGTRALVAGAALGTFPDLDILAYPLLDEVQRLYWHRGESHSIFFVLFGSLATVFILQRFCLLKNLNFKKAFMGVLLIYGTHILIDLFTIYGTQLLAPVSRTGYGFGNFFIMDPLFTLPLFLGIIGAIVCKPDRALRLNCIGLLIACLYTVWSFSLQAAAESKFTRQLASQDISVTRQLTTAAPFTTLLWRHVAETPDGFLMAYWSVFDTPGKTIRFHYIPKQADIVETVRGSRAFEAVEWFSKGWWFAIKSDEQHARVVDLRFTEIPAARRGSHLYWNWPFAWNFSLELSEEVELNAITPDVRQPLKVLHLLVERIQGGDGWLSFEY